MADSVAYTFVCPTCRETMEVNESMREALLSHGCVVCGSSVSGEAFVLN